MKQLPGKMRLLVLLLTVSLAAGAHASFSYDTGMMRALQTPADTSDHIFVRVFRDSVPGEGNRYHQVEARVVEGKILSVYVDAVEVPTQDYDIYVANLQDILREEKDLYNSLFRIMQEIDEKKKEIDSLGEVPYLVDGERIVPGEDLQQQIMDLAMDKAREQAAPAPDDTLPAPPVLPDDRLVRRLSDSIQILRNGRDMEKEMIRGEIVMLEQRAEEIRHRLETLDAYFEKEKIEIHSDKNKRKKSRKNMKRKKRKKRKTGKG